MMPVWFLQNRTHALGRVWAGLGKPCCEALYQPSCYTWKRTAGPGLRGTLK